MSKIEQATGDAATGARLAGEGSPRRKSKFWLYGEEMIEKAVKSCGGSGRVYLPPEWIGKSVKIIRLD